MKDPTPAEGAPDSWESGMKLLENLPPELLAGALEVCSVLRRAGHQAVFAGGVVRDCLLRRPVSDVDIATTATPGQIESLFQRTHEIGREFGVTLVLIDERPFEVTTFRREGKYEDGRHPSSVEFTDIQDDARRRDFTINALFLDPSTGELIDLVSGREDLQASLIRSVGKPRQRFQEDKLRLLRAVRFSSQLGFDIEDSTWQAVLEMTPGIRQVSWERIRDELLKLLTSAQAADGLRRLFESGLMEQILPDVAKMDGVQQPPEYHPEGDVFIHTCLLFELGAPISDPVLALAMLLHDVGKPPTFQIADRIRFNGHAEVGAEMAAVICRQFRLPTKETQQVVELVRDHLRFIHVMEMRESTLKRFLGRSDFERHLELHRLDCLASHGDLTAFDFCRQKLEEFRNQPLRPQPLISGHDLIQLGLKPGPVFTVILRELEDLQLEEQIQTREAALDWARARLA